MKLYEDVTSAIMEAERHERKDPRSAETKAAYAKVSELEERIAGLKDIPKTERNIGRRGSITAAVMSGNIERARSLLYRFEDEPEFDKGINQELRLLVSKPELIYTYDLG